MVNINKEFEVPCEYCGHKTKVRIIGKVPDVSKKITLMK